MRLKDRALLLALALSNRLSWIAAGYHLTTDPACEHYREPRHGSRLDRASRGFSCYPCMRPGRHRR